MIPRVLLLIPTTSYKTRDFMHAAAALGVDVVIGTDRRQALEATQPGHTIAFDLADTARSLSEIRRAGPFAAVIGVDDETALLATEASEALGLPHNPPASIRATRDKFELRQRLAADERPGPDFRLVSRREDPLRVAQTIDYPCVLKPLRLSAGRGVIRADDVSGFVEAFGRLSAILDDPEVARLKGSADHVLVERFLPGDEFAIEGLLVQGRLTALAVFDKPDPLEGPFFEETLLVTPSRHGSRVETALVAEAQAGCRALGLVDGPVHAELRLWDGRPWIVEIAARTIGGICSRSLRFGTGLSLEQVVLGHALGRPMSGLTRERAAAGVMMLPIPRRGILREVRGIAAARRIRHVEEVEISLHLGAEVVPLPEGHRYLGFVFARAGTPRQVEQALRQAHERLTFVIEP